MTGASEQTGSSMVGRLLEKYRILEEVGHGGMAVVYKALDTSLNREVAVKVLHPVFSSQKEARLRLQREAHAVAKLRHENILEIFGYSGLDSPESFIVTELIRGETLRDFLERRKLAHPELAAMLVSDVCRALAHAHALGVIHRDVKPENVMIRDDGLLKLTDFGIAQIVDSERMTVTGQLLGSPAYMAPEQVQGKPLDFRTDVFAAGVLLYQLATGELPFKGKNPHEVLKRIADGRFVDPRIVQPRVGAELARIIALALARDPEDRYPTIDALTTALADELAPLGLHDTRLELRAFFADPEGYEAQLRERLITALLGEGKRALGQRRVARALEQWNRVLSIDASHAETLALVGRVGRRRRAVRAVLVTLAAAVAAAAAWTITSRLPTRLSRPPGREAPSAHAAPSAGAPGAAAAAARAAATRAAAAAIEPPARHPARPAGPPRTLDLKVRPLNYTVLLDGRPLGLVDRVEVPPGRHRLRVENPGCCIPEERLIDDATAALEPIRLRWRDAVLEVETSASVVEVDGKVVAPGQSLPIRIEGIEDREQRVEVTVRKEGRSATRAVIVRGGERTVVKLEP